MSNNMAGDAGIVISSVCPCLCLSVCLSVCLFMQKLKKTTEHELNFLPICLQGCRNGF